MIGVDIFFVISGFVILHTVKRSSKKATTKHFIFNRMTRIFPVYWLVSLSLLPVFFLKPGWVNSGAEHATSLIHSFLLIPHEGAPLIMVGWTLEYEMFFYVCFAVALNFVRRTPELVLIALFMLLICIGIYFPSSSSEPIREVMTSPLLIYFVAGMLMARYYKAIPTSNSIIAAVLIAWVVFTVNIAAYQFEEINRVLHYAPTAITTVLLFIMFEKRGVVFHKATSLWGGNISYSLYIIHVLCISALGRLWLAYGKEYVSSEVMLLGAMLLSVVCATVMYSYFEKPVIKAIRNINSKV